MGRRAKNSTVEVVEGLYLKSQPNTVNLQAYCRINSQTFRKSVGTDNVAKAKSIALDWYYDLKQQAKKGILLKKVSFNELTDAYLKTIPKGAKFEYHAPTIERHFETYFGKYTDIRLITEGTVSDYIVHRRAKSKTEPTPQTLNRENTVLRQLFQYAAKQRWIAEPITVPFLNQSQTVRRRRHFTIEEYRTLLKTAKTRITQSKNEPRQRHVRQNRLLIYDVIILLANSGMRVDEMKTVTWRNIDWAKGDIVLERAGKKKSSRRLVLRKSAVNALTRIAKRRKAWLKTNDQPETLNPNERAIALSNGVAVNDFKRAFRDILHDCGFVYTDTKDRHTLTSLRHTYATFSLTRTRGKRTSIRTLVKQMDTSERMINAHYGHDDIEDYRDELRGDLN